jgi:hypothetical protein
MRWLMIALFVSVAALLAVSGGLAHHIWQEHKQKRRPAGKRDEVDVETEETP